MKYLMMIWSNPRCWEHPTFLHTAEAAALTGEDRAELTGRFTELLKELVASGELVGTHALAAPADGFTVRAPGGVPSVTDGPYAETKEQFAGYFLVDCVGPERAREIAARFPDALFGAVEVRPVMDLPAPQR